MKKIFWLMIIEIMSIGLLVGCGSSGSIDLMDYVTVNYAGVDGNGTASIGVDYTKMEQDLVGDDDGNISREELERLEEITAFEMTVNYQLDVEDGLSNGDKVTVTVSYDSDIAQEKKIKVSGDSAKFEVSGLIEPVEVDAFDSSVFNTENGICLNYVGIAPEAYLDIENHCSESAPQYYVTYTIDNEGYLKNGDTVTITASVSAQGESMGYVLKEAQKTITVEGLDSYVTSLSELNESDRAFLENKLSEFFTEKVSQSWFDFYAADGNCVSLSAEAGASYSQLTFLDTAYDMYYNASVIAFKVDINNAEYYWWGTQFYDNKISKTFTGATGYFLVYDLIINGNGELVTDDMYIDAGAVYETQGDMETAISGLS